MYYLDKCSQSVNLLDNVKRDLPHVSWKKKENAGKIRKLEICSTYTGL